jgi:hypothetical protein
LTAIAGQKPGYQGKCLIANLPREGNTIGVIRRYDRTDGSFLIAYSIALPRLRLPGINPIV